MQVNRARDIIMIMLLMAGCVEPFTPELEETQESMVVEALITDMEGDQHVYVSLSSPYSDPGFIPVSGCNIEIIDDASNSYSLAEGDHGDYSVWMPQSSLVAGRAYMLQITTLDGRVYQSGFETMPGPSPPIDSIYHEVKYLETENPDYNIGGLQFSIDLNAGEDDPGNYRWVIEETWKYRANYPIQAIYDNGIILNPDPAMLYYCWKTENLTQIFTATTQHLTVNRLKKYPLHFVSNQTSRLSIRYSFLIRQYALSGRAYGYWNQMQVQTQETGGFYEHQPALLKGNISNTGDPDELVLGYFNVSSVSEKRIFVDRDDYRFRFLGPVCTLDTLNSPSELEAYAKGGRRFYMFSLSMMGVGFPWATAGDFCFDCTMAGGTTTRPDFWID